MRPKKAHRARPTTASTERVAPRSTLRWILPPTLLTSGIVDLIAFLAIAQLYPARLPALWLALATLSTLGIIGVHTVRLGQTRSPLERRLDLSRITPAGYLAFRRTVPIPPLTRPSRALSWSPAVWPLAVSWTSGSPGRTGCAASSLPLGCGDPWQPPPSSSDRSVTERSSPVGSRGSLNMTLAERIHQPTRLRQPAALAALPLDARFAFTRLPDLLALTDGNVSTHLARSEESGDVSTRKTFLGPEPRTCE